ncbi:MAG: hypothetical protein PHQ35_05130 [Phycisphaerae bacterium]|nr:hypothetical protein [Phycisphaerae bacterium]MDD5380900.1 hypothetical protein [Phycisphaerae bacterium]
MGNEKGAPKFFDNFLFPKIFQTFRIAIQPSKLIIAFAALVIICLSGWIMDLSKTVVTTPKAQGGITELQVYITNPDKVKLHIEYYKICGGHTGVFSTLWRFGSEKFHGALQSLFAFDLPGVAKNIIDGFKALMWAIRYHYFYSIPFLAITFAVISLGGGGLCRIAALQFAGNEKPGITEALRFSTKRFMSFFTVPLAPVGTIICIGLFIFLLGLIGNIPRIGELILGVFMLPALIAGTLITIVLIGTVAGFNLMFPAIVYDGSDCLDAISRSFSYVYSKPWRMGFYTAIAAVYGAVCYIFVRFLTFLLLWVTRWFLQLFIWADNSSHRVNKLTAIWPEPSFMCLRGAPGWVTANWSESLAIFLIYLALLVVVGLLVSFVISFYFSANTIIYALMRNRVDNTALQDIYTSAAEAKTESIAAEFEPEKSQVQPRSKTQHEPSDSDQ